MDDRKKIEKEQARHGQIKLGYAYGVITVQ
jgi:hypothetical protein